MFNLFRKKQESVLSFDKGLRDMVFDLADFLAKNNPKIPDAALLPHPKAQLLRAYEQFHAYLTSLKESRDPRFHAEGGEERLNQVGAMWVLLDDFSVIDPEDKQIVTDINSGRNTDPTSEVRLWLKYTGKKKDM